MKKACTVFVQDVLHNINLMRTGKWRRLIRISLRLNILNVAIFCLLEGAVIAFGFFTVNVNALPGAR